MRLKKAIAWVPAPAATEEDVSSTPRPITNGASKLPRSLRRQAKTAMNAREHSQGFAPPRRVFQRHR